MQEVSGSFLRKDAPKGKGKGGDAELKEIMQEFLRKVAPKGKGKRGDAELKEEDKKEVKTAPQWQLALDGSFTATGLWTTQTLTNTPFPCSSCGCSFIDRNGVATHCDMETNSRKVVARWLPENSTMLEIGARYGSNSCAMAAKQKESGRLVVVDADARVWDALEKNRVSHTCNFQTVRGLIGKHAAKIVENGYGTLATPAAIFTSLDPFSWAEQNAKTAQREGTSMAQVFTLDAVQQKYNLKFDTANFDCEGCLPYVMKDFPELQVQLKMLMIESHNEQEEAVVSQLLTNGWELVDLVGRQRVLVNESQTRRLQGQDIKSHNSKAKYLFDTDSNCTLPVGASGFRANIGQSCEQVCATKNMQCNLAGMKELRTQASVSKAFAATGNPCKSLVDHKIASYWAGPWNAGGACGYSSHPDWQPNCRGKAACGYRLACSCQ